MLSGIIQCFECTKHGVSKDTANWKKRLLHMRHNLKPFVCSTCGKCFTLDNDKCCTLNDSIQEARQYPDASSACVHSNGSSALFNRMHCQSDGGYHNGSTSTVYGQRSQESCTRSDHQFEHKERCDSKAWFVNESVNTLEHSAQDLGSENVPSPSVTGRWASQYDEQCESKAWFFRECVSTSQHSAEDSQNFAGPSITGAAHECCCTGTKPIKFEEGSGHSFERVENDKRLDDLTFADNEDEEVNESKSCIWKEGDLSLSECLPDTGHILNHTRTSQSSETPSNLVENVSAPTNLDIDGNSVSWSGGIENLAEINPKFQSKKKNYKCCTCGEYFSKKCYLKKHQQTHTSEVPHQCDECGKGFANKSAFTKHKSSHCGKKTQKCDGCEKGFIDKQDLLKHKRSAHSGTKSHTCSECGAEFIAKSSLKLHCKRVHTGERPYKCGECEKSFLKLDHLKRHKYLHIGVRPYPCEECGKGFVSKNDLKKHFRVHTGERPYACKQCDKSYTQSSGLTNHIQKYHQGNPLQSPVENRYANTRFCKVCGKGFPSNAHLKVHERVHTGEKPFKCEQCGRCFSSRHHLTRHALIHTGEKPHECWVCGEKFMYSTSLTIHIRTHTGEKPYRCAHCEESFISCNLLKGHISKCHLDKDSYDTTKTSRSLIQENE